MRMNKYLTSTLLAGLFITGATFSPATAQEQSLQPQGAWAITKVDRSAQGGNSYCTLSRKYDDGIVLSLGRNQTEEYSLAIDFQKDVFKRDKALKISLQPGPGQIRAYDMMPASEKAMVIRLGWDTGFFDTLNSSQQMRVKIGENSYAFAMPEVAKGQEDLQDCMKDLKVAANGDEKSTPTKDVLNAQIETSSGEFNAAKADTKMPTAASIAAQKEQVDKQEKALLEGFANSIRAQEPSLNDGTKTASRNFGKINGNEDAAPKTIELADAKPTAAKKEAFAKVSEPDVKKVETPVEPVKKPDLVSDKDLKEMEKRLAAANAENNALKHKTIDSLTEMQERVKTLEAEKKLLAEQVRQAEMEEKRKSSIAIAANDAVIDSTKAEVAVLEKRLGDITSENASLMQRLNATQKEAQDKAALAQAATTSTDGVKAQIAALEKRLADMAVENTALKQQASVVKPEILAQIDALKVEKKALNDKLVAAQTEAQTKAAIASTASTTTDAAKKQIAEFERRLADMGSENAALKQQVASLSPEAQAKIDAANAKVKALEEENRKQAMAVASAMSAAKTTMTPLPDAPTEKEVRELQKKLAEVQAENAKLKASPAQVATSASSASTEVVAKLEAENKTLSDKIALLEQTAGANAAKPEALAAVEAKAKELAIKNEQLEDTLRKAQVRIAEAALNTESKSLKQIADLEAKLEAAKNDNMKLAKDLDDTKLKMENKQLSMVSGDATLVSATKRYNEAEREIRRLGLQVEKAKETCSVEKAQIENMLFDPAVADEKQIERLHALEAENAALKAGGTGMVVNASAGDESEQVRLLQENLQGMKAANDEFNAQNEILRQETERLRLQLAEAQENGGARADRVASSNIRMEELKRELALKDKQNLTYHNQLVAMQKQKGKGGSDADTMNDILPSAGTVISSAVVGPVNDKNVNYGKGNLEKVFKKAGLSVGSLTKASGGMGMTGADNYGWSDSKVKGVASVKSIGNGNFTKMVDQYIAAKKKSCGGDFASMPSNASSKGGKTISLYEVACVGAAESVSSSLLFYEDQGRFVAISNDIEAADMDIAMDSRDKLASAVGGL